MISPTACDNSEIYTIPVDDSYYTTYNDLGIRLIIIIIYVCSD